MAELRADLSFPFNTCRPANHYTITCAAKVGSHLFCIGEGSVHGNSPTCCIMGIGIRSAPFIIMLHHILYRFLYTIEVGHLVKKSIHGSFSAGTIISNDVDKYCIVNLAQVFNGSIEPADLMVGMFAKTGIYFHLVRKHFLFIGGKPVPVLYIGGLGS